MAEAISAAAPNTPLAGDSPSGLTINSPPSIEKSDAASEVDALGLPRKSVKKKSAETSAKPEEVKPEPKKFKLKVDNKEVEIDEAEAMRRLQKDFAADKRMEQAAKERKASEQRHREADEKLAKASEILSQYEGDNPLDALIAKHGIEKVRAMTEPFLLKQIQLEMMDPKEKALLDEKTRAESLQNQLKAREEEDQKVKFEAETQKYVGEYQKTILTALESGEIPQTPASVKAMADYMIAARQRGIEYTSEQLVNLVREDKIEEAQSLTKNLVAKATAAKQSGDMETVIRCGEQVVSIYGDEIVNLIRMYDLARIRQGQPAVPKPVFQTPRTQQTDQATPKKMGWDEWQDERKKRAARIDAGEPLGDW